MKCAELVQLAVFCTLFSLMLAPATANATNCEGLLLSGRGWVEIKRVGRLGLPSAKAVLGKLEFVKTEGRSGRWFRDSKGIEWYVKPDEQIPELQTAAEIIAAAVYKKLYYDVPDTHLFEFEGKRHIFSEKAAGARERNLAHLDSPELRQSRFVAAYLKDWDRFAGMNNFAGDHGRFTFIDFGGALGARATGRPKPGEVFSPAIGSFEATDDIGIIYGGFNIDAIPSHVRLPDYHPWRKVTREDAIAITQKFSKDLTDESIEEIVDKAHYSRAEDARYMVRALKLRRDGIVRDLVSLFPETTVQAPNVAHQRPLQITRKLIDQKLFLVHATNFFPKGGMIKSGQRKTPRFLPTTHFALGELVRPHTYGSWEDSKYAIIVPYGKVLKQLVSVFPQDTIALGDVALPTGTVIVAAKAARVERSSCCAIVEFDPSREKLREVIDRVIAEEHGWNIHAAGGMPDDSVRFGDINLNLREFFEPLLRENKNLSYDLNSKTILGKIDIRLIELFGAFSEGRISLNYSSYALKLELLRFEWRLRQIDRRIAEMELPEEALAGYRRARASAEGWVDLLRADLEMRDQYRKTLLTETNGPKLKKLRMNPEKLRQYMTSAPGEKPKELNEDFSPDWDLQFMLEDLGLKDFEEVLRRNPDLVAASGGLTFLMAEKALSLVDQKHSETKENAELMALFDRGIREVDGLNFRALVARYISVFPSPKLKRANITSPEMMAKLKKTYNIQMLLGRSTEHDLEYDALKEK